MNNLFEMCKGLLRSYDKKEIYYHALTLSDQTEFSWLSTQDETGEITKWFQDLTSEIRKFEADGAVSIIAKKEVVSVKIRRISAIQKALAPLYCVFRGDSPGIAQRIASVFMKGTLFGALIIIVCNMYLAGQPLTGPWEMEPLGKGFYAAEVYIRTLYTSMMCALFTIVAGKVFHYQWEYLNAKAKVIGEYLKIQHNSASIGHNLGTLIFVTWALIPIYQQIIIPTLTQIIEELIKLGFIIQ